MKELTKLPEKWCILKNKQEICDWFTNFGDGSYSLCDRNDEYIHYPSIKHTHIYSHPLEGYTEITFEQFKKWVLKEEETIKQDNIMKTKERFTIGGSEGLRRAFVEEVKGNLYTPTIIIGYNNLIPKTTKNIFIGSDSNYPIHYQLPKDWEEAKQACIDYWKEDEFKVGDWVVITKNGAGTNDKDVGLVCKIVDTNAGNRSRYSRYTIEIDRDKVGNGDRFTSPTALRKATPEEIKEALLAEVKHRYPVGTKFNCLSGFGEGVVKKDDPYWSSDRIWISSTNNGGSITCYMDGKWAEILPNEIKLPFGKLTFTINRNKKTATCSEGTITYKEIKAVVDWFAKDFTLLGHKMQIVNEGKWYIGFGCCKTGTLTEAKAILAAFD